MKRVNVTTNLRILPLLLVLPVGCIPVDATENTAEVVGIAESALEDPNALNPNALNRNALNPNALNPNALSPNALNPNTLSPSALTAIQDPGPDGDLSRQLIHYVVGCAFDRWQSFRFTWTDSSALIHQEEYWGIVGLTPGWNQGPLDEEGQRWVTACLGSRVNWYGISVVLSSRGSHPALNTEPFEFLTYFAKEGAFWGNLFSANPFVNTCYNALTVDYSRQKWRDCAAGHVSTDPETHTQTIEQCGILRILGPCSSFCSLSLSLEQYYYSCVDNPSVSSARTKAVITTYLQ